MKRPSSSWRTARPGESAYMKSYTPFVPKAMWWRLADICGMPEKTGVMKCGFMFEFHLATISLDVGALDEVYELVASLSKMPFYENAARFVIPATAARL